MVLYVLWVHHDTGLHKLTSLFAVGSSMFSVLFVMSVASSDPHGVIPGGIFSFLEVTANLF